MCSDSIDLLTREIQSMWPVERWANYRVVLAVSGGADSIALLRAMVQLRNQLTADETESGKLVVGHFNHKLRGEDSDADAEFVEELAEHFGLPFHCGEPDSNSDSTSESDLRDQRYRFLENLARRTNSRYIATAHHQDDQVETVLFRLFRGTGLRGICGIPFSRVLDESISVVRPLLKVERQTIEDALKQWQQPWRQDFTNAESIYSRNFLRNEILPLLRERFVAVDRSLVRLSKQTQEHCNFVEEMARPLWGAVSNEGEYLVLDCVPLAGTPRVLVRELVMQIYQQQGWSTAKLGFDDVEKLAAMAFNEGDVPLFQLPGGVNASKQGARIRLVGPLNDVPGYQQRRD